jgi:hypothetical protein
MGGRSEDSKNDSRGMGKASAEGDMNDNAARVRGQQELPRAREERARQEILVVRVQGRTLDSRQQEISKISARKQQIISKRATSYQQENSKRAAKDQQESSKAMATY